MTSIIAAFCCITSLLTQDLAKVPEPEYIGIVAVLNSNGDLLPLERQRPKYQVKLNIAGVRTTTTFRGAQSPIRLPAGQPLEFVVRLDTAGYDPYEIIQLLPLVVAKDNRQFLIMKSGVMGFSPRVNDAQIPLNIARYGQQSYRIVPTVLLPPGEYAIDSGTLTFCFGIDPAK